MKFKKGDFVICEYDRVNRNYDSYDTFYCNGKIINFLYTNGSDIMYLVLLDEPICKSTHPNPSSVKSNQIYFYEKKIKLDKIKIRNFKLNLIGI